MSCYSHDTLSDLSDCPQITKLPGRTQSYPNLRKDSIVERNLCILISVQASTNGVCQRSRSAKTCEICAAMVLAKYFLSDENLSVRLHI